MLSLVLNGAINILIVVSIFGVVIFIHELGHYIAARLLGAKVLEFSLGMGPKIIGKKIKGIEYNLRAFPIGGYVQILGEGDNEDDDAKNPGNLKNRPKSAQLVIMLSGVVMNLLLAVAIYYYFIISFGFKWPLGEELKDFEPFYGEVKIEKVADLKYSEIVEDGGFAEAETPESGLIKSVDGEVIDTSDQLIIYIQKHKDSEVNFELCNEECTVYPVKVSKDGKAGILLPQNYEVNLMYDGNRKYLSGFAHSLNMVKLIAGKLSEISDEAQETGDYEPVLTSVSGPIGVYFAVDHFKQFGILTLVGFIADFSLTLTILNLLPIPALDGGRVILLLVEMITGKPLNKKFEATLINVSFALLMLLMVAIILKDIIYIDVFKRLFE